MQPNPQLAATAGEPRLRRLLPAALLVVACTLGGCAGDDSDGSGPASTDQTTAVGPPTTAATSTTGEGTTTTTGEAATTSAGSGSPSATHAADNVECRPVSFPSAGRDLPGERCEPTGSIDDGPRPAALIIGGCGGYEGDLTLKRGLATSLATAGVITLIVDYHAAAPAPPETYCQPSPETLAAVPAMLSAVTDATAWLRADPTVDGAAIGAVGYSLGGLWAAYAHVGDVDLASVPPASFSAIAMLASPMFPDAIAAAQAGGMPPLYLLHGALDDVVSVDDSTHLAQAARAGGTEATLVVVPAMDHGWSEPNASAERADAIADITEFITSHLAQTG